MKTLELNMDGSGLIINDYEDNEEILLLLPQCLEDFSQVYGSWFLIVVFHLLAYFNKLAKVAIMVAILVIPVPMASFSAVVIMDCAFVGTTISQPGRTLAL